MRDARLIGKFRDSDRHVRPARSLQTSASMRIDMKRSLAGLLVSACVVVSGCSASTSGDNASFSDSTPENAGAASPGSGASESTAPSSPGTGFSGATGGTGDPGAPNQSATPQPGQLTAGVWDDNLNYDFFKQYLSTQQAALGGSMFTVAERDAAHDRSLLPRSAKTELDVAIVLDTTSSMGDEITYLQTEFESIATTIKTKFPQTTPRFGLVVYRDHVDTYLTKSVEFTTDVDAFRASLAAQSANGGGDIPEAVPEGLTAGDGLGWRTADNVARVMFWVADAPQHPGEEQNVNVAVGSALQKGIHVYPVGASGVDNDAELAMRQTAQITGGRYLFLTDDSGIGNAHAEPHIPCYVVTALHGAMARMVQTEMLGTRAEPVASEILRTVGAPVDGKCTLQDKSSVVLY
jgi:hypothetical protein